MPYEMHPVVGFGQRGEQVLQAGPGKVPDVGRGLIVRENLAEPVAHELHRLQG